MNQLIEYLSSAFVLIPLMLGIIKKIYFQKNTLPLFILLIITLVVEIANVIYSLIGINNIFIINFYTPIEFILFILFYRSFFDTIRKSWLHYLLILLFLGISVFDAFYITDKLMIDNFAPSVESIIFILYSLLAFFFIMKRLMYPNLLNTSFFWINIAILIYFAGNLFLFLFSSHLQRNDWSQYLALYNIHSVTNILYYILLSIGFWKTQVQ